MVTPVPIDEEEEYDNHNNRSGADRSGSFIDNMSFKGGNSDNMLDDASGAQSHTYKSGYGTVHHQPRI